MTEQEKIKLDQELSEAYSLYGEALRKWAYYKVNDHSVSQDLVQNTFIKTWNYMIQGGEIKLMKAFLYHVLNNLIVDEYRKRKTVSLEALLDKGYEPSVHTEDRLYNVMDGKRALDLISKIPKKYQKIMRMRYENEMTIKEMADQTGLSKNTIAVQSYRGLKKLRFEWGALEAKAL